MTGRSPSAGSAVIGCRRLPLLPVIDKMLSVTGSGNASVCRCCRCAGDKLLKFLASVPAAAGSGRHRQGPPADAVNSLILNTDSAWPIHRQQRLYYRSRAAAAAAPAAGERTAADCRGQAGRQLGATCRLLSQPYVARLGLRSASAEAGPTPRWSTSSCATLNVAGSRIRVCRPLDATHKLSGE